MLTIADKLAIEARLVKIAVRNIELNKAFVENGDKLIFDVNNFKIFLKSFGFKVSDVKAGSSTITVNYSNKQKESEDGIKSFKNTIYYHPFVKDVVIDIDKNEIVVTTKKDFNEKL